MFEHGENEAAGTRRKGRGNMYSKGKLVRKVTGGQNCLLETKQKKSKFPSGKIRKDRQYLLTGSRKQENQTHNCPDSYPHMQPKTQKQELGLMTRT